jgi:hypothetical protein
MNTNTEKPQSSPTPSTAAATSSCSKFSYEITHGSGGFKVWEDREFVVHTDRDRAIVEWTIRCLANPDNLLTADVLKEISYQRNKGRAKLSTNFDDPDMEDPSVIQKEMLELSIKSGRRLMHDFKHMLSEVPDGSILKKDFEVRGKVWEDIFYPDHGMKNYRSELHQTIINLDFELERVKRLLKEKGIDPTPDLPY